MSKQISYKKASERDERKTAKAANVNSVVYLRNKNDRGPSAWSSGVECLQRITELYFYDPLPTRTKNCVMMHTYNLTSPAHEIESIFLRRLHDEILDKSHAAYQLRVISDNFPMEGIMNVRSNFITLTDFYILIADNFDKLYYNIRHFVAQASAWNPSGKFIILFNNPSIKDFTKVSIQIFRMMKNKFHATNVVIVFGSGIAPYKILKGNPFQGENCRDITTTNLGTCEFGEITDSTKVEEILKRPIAQFDIENCDFHFCATVAKPFVDDGCSDGLEIELINILKKVMKFQIRTFCTDLERGNFLDNGTITGLLGMILTDECDFIAGGYFPDDEVHKEFAVTQTYFQDSYTWFVPVAQSRPHWQGLLMIFDPSTWVVLIFILILCGFSWFLFGMFPPEMIQHKQLALSFLNAYALFIGVSANNRPTEVPLRVFFIVLSLYALNVTTIYTSNLIAVFTHDEKLHQIDTVEELLESGLRLGGRQEYRDWFKNVDEGDHKILIHYNISTDFLPTDENLKRVKDGYQAILANRLFVKTSSISSKIFAFEEDVFSNQLEMIMIKGFPLLPEMNQLISLLKDSGMIIRLMDQFNFNISIVSNIRKIRDGTADIEDTAQIVLTTGHLEGPFAIVICGLLLSISVFIIELISVSPVRQLVIFLYKYFIQKRDQLLIMLGLKLKQEPVLKKISKRSGTFFRVIRK